MKERRSSVLCISGSPRGVNCKIKTTGRRLSAEPALGCGLYTGVTVCRLPRTANKVQLRTAGFTADYPYLAIRVGTKRVRTLHSESETPDANRRPAEGPRPVVFKLQFQLQFRGVRPLTY